MVPPIPPQALAALMQSGQAGLAGIGQQAGQLGMNMRGMMPKSFDLGGGSVLADQRARMRDHHQAAVAAMFGG